ncbi:MAG: BamA/TamA family outer membrane protein [Flavisolibacter sp.]
MLQKILMLLVAVFYVLHSFGQEDTLHSQVDLIANHINSNTKAKSQADTIIVIANNNLKGTGLKNFLIGKNYREEWIQPIKVPILNFKLDGLKTVKEGGGKQTRSIRIQDQSGKQWTLRSVEKFPIEALPADLRSATAIKNIITDGISASYPFGVLSMSVFNNAAGIPYLKNRLVYLSDDEGLESFRDKYKNTLVFMEERQPLDVEKMVSTEDLIQLLNADNDYHVDQNAVLKIRLLDNFVMDLDRHEGQWGWVCKSTGKVKIYYPVAKDRDQVFFTNQGFLPGLAKLTYIAPELQGFRAKTKNIRTFNRAARNFDRTFLTELTREEWIIQIDSFLNAMTYDVIELAMQQQPLEIQQFHSQKIINILKKRKSFFKTEMLDYYDFLSKIVSVVGTNKREQFTIIGMADKKVQVKINKIAKDNSISTTIYNRVFDARITKEIRLFGLDDNDVFILEGDQMPIKIRIIGGPGDDEFINHCTIGKKRIWIYDAAYEENSIAGNSGIHNRISSDAQINRYDRLGYKYNNLMILPSFKYNVDDGLFIGPKLEYIKQGFRKDPFGMRQYFTGEYAFQTTSYHFDYEADYNHIIGKMDLLIRSDVKAPENLTNFFGIGNNTSKDLNRKYEYYKTRYNIIDAGIYLRHNISTRVNFIFGPFLQYFRVDSLQNKDRFVNETGSLPDHATLYKAKIYMGGEVKFNVNTRNNNLIPTHGILLSAEVKHLFGINGYSHDLTELKADIRIFINLVKEGNIVIATRLGAAHNIGNYEFPQAQYLSGTDNLRGYRKQRFAGRSLLFNNTECRIKLANFNTYLFPGTFGIQIFNDIGRVYSDNEISGKWHDGYGYGIWIAPIRRFIITGSLGYSDEEKSLPRITLGFEF